MNLGYFSYPLPVNEPVHSYGPGSAERSALKKTIAELKGRNSDIPMYIGGKEVRTGSTVAIHPPHETLHVLGQFHAGDESHVRQAIDAALLARESWANTSWENRANVFFACRRPYINQIPLPDECYHHVGAE